MNAGSRSHAEFVAEATEILDQLGGDLLRLDERRGQAVDPELLNAIFRAAHSLKGLAGMFGQDRVAQLAHQAEDLLDRLRLGKTRLNEGVLDALVSTLDVLQLLVTEISRGESSEALRDEALQLGARLAQLGEAGAEAALPGDPLDAIGLDPGMRAVLTEYEEHRLRDNLRRGMSLWTLRADFNFSDFDMRLAELNASLKPVGELVSTLPSAEPGDASRISFELIFGTNRDFDDIASAVAGLPVRIEPLHPVAVSPLPGGPPTLRSLTQTVRVDIARLDALMNAVGELLLTRNNLQRLAESAPRQWGQELARETRQLQRKLDEVQKGILEVRMVPLGQVFEKLARLVRRIARDEAREISLQVTGEEVELDKLILEELSDPLMHIVHNAIAHGVESPDERARRGKPPAATIWLRARQQGNHVVLEVGDDGPGIDEARVREVALTRGLLTPAQADGMSRRELQNLIFLPGFSTARSVSELSGRGVGLDVVKTNIANLSGIIDLHSEPGEGTRFSITLPLTLAIVRALVVEVSGRSYAVPLNSVIEIFAVSPSELRTVEGREMVELRGQTVPLVRLARLFGHPERATRRHYVVVVGLAQQRLGIAVDDLGGQQDIVTKPLGGRLRHVRGISGATQLGNRRTVLVLDVGALVEEALSGDRSSR